MCNSAEFLEPHGPPHRTPSLGAAVQARDPGPPAADMQPSLARNAAVAGHCGEGTKESIELECEGRRTSGMSTSHRAIAGDVEGVEAVTRAWEQARANGDVEALVACYAPGAVLESPIAAHILGGRGICLGHGELRRFFTEVVARTPGQRKYYRAGFFTDGHRATWEYPRQTPDGEQIDLVEIMEIDNGLIQAHRIYFGWRGVDILVNDQYHRE